MAENTESYKNLNQILLGNAHAIADEKLFEEQEFQPFAVVMNREGEMSPVYVEEQEGLDSYGILESLNDYCGEALLTEEVVLCGIVYDATIELEGEKEEVNAIAVELWAEHDEKASVYYIPYIFEEDDIAYGDVIPLNE